MKRTSFVIKDKSLAFIDPKAKIGDNVIIYENVHISGNSVIEENVTIFPNSFIDNSIIGKGTKIYSSVIEKSVLGSCCMVGPFASLKKGTILGSHVSVGSFCSLKNAEIGAYSKVACLSSVSDVKIGESAILESGVTFSGGSDERLSVVGDKAIIGANASVVAPCQIKAKTKIQPCEKVSGSN